MRRTQRVGSCGVAMAVMATGCADGAATIAAVRPGIDVLLTDSAHLVRDVRVGILTNQSGRDARGVDDITRLRDAGVRLTAIFSPEHGFRGVLDEENIGHGVDSATGLPVFSLYGAVRAPTPDMLDRVDVLLIDLQDIGARPYTYVATALLAVEAAAGAEVRVVILDRPNPLGGALVQGPLMDADYTSFNGMLPVPLRHGMTLGELVRWGNGLLGHAGDVRVAPLAGWTRDRWYDDTGLPWVRPSPNMPDLESATHYPGLVLFEPTTVSVGRGTPIAFQVLAAPWLDAPALAAVLDTLPGVAVRDTAVRPDAPTDRKYGGELLPAVRLTVTDRATYDPTMLAVHALSHLLRTHPGDFRFTNPARFDRFAGSDALRQALEAGADPAAIVRGWTTPLDTFRATRAPHLLY